MASTRALVVSMSELALFKRCKKAWELGYVRNLEPIVTSEPVQLGSAFHAEMEAYATMRRGFKPKPPQHERRDEMVIVADEYIRRKACADFDKMQAVLRVEEPIYVPIVPARAWENILEQFYRGLGVPSVYLRMTFDLNYKRQNGHIVLRDYKTFDAMPSQDYDLDYQARVYIAGGMQFYSTPDIEFEFEHVRRCVPGTKRGAEPAKGKPDKRLEWQENECYVTQPLFISEQEARDLWAEMRHDIGSLLLTRVLGQHDPAAYSRTSLKGHSPYTCGSCFYKRLCKADYDHSLDADFIKEWAKVRTHGIEDDAKFLAGQQA